VTVYNKNLSRLCSLLAQIEQVQDKRQYVTCTFSTRQ